MSEFANRLVIWQKKHGRHDLPWQTPAGQTADPYPIWVSEIMLQQTQVAAVIAYYSKFMARFPNIAALASAEQQEVLQYWSGLGYYSRARNLHKAAQKIAADFGGKFPQDFEVIQTLPGIGRSTAAAICAFAFQHHTAILDGNVKRVLARHFLIEGWSGTPTIEKKMWTLAESLLPTKNIDAYTQGLMDLGATICTRNKPKCYLCPFLNTCAAYEHERVAELPTPKPRKALPTKKIAMLVLQHEGHILLEKRPEKGIWGGLFSLPEIQVEADVAQIIQENFKTEISSHKPLAAFTHVFTHFRLDIHPHVVEIKHLPKNPLQNDHWLSLESAIEAAIPTPIRHILQTLNDQAGY